MTERRSLGLVVRRSVGTWPKIVVWVQLVDPGVENALQGSKVEAIIVQSTVVFLWLSFSSVSVVCFVRKKPQESRSLFKLSMTTAALESCTVMCGHVDRRFVF
jgi:hypothetical protein